MGGITVGGDEKLTTLVKAVRQEARQAGIKDLLLRGAHVVKYAHEFDRICLGFEDGVHFLCSGTDEGQMRVADIEQPLGDNVEGKGSIRRITHIISGLRLAGLSVHKKGLDIGMNQAQAAQICQVFGR